MILSSMRLFVLTNKTYTTYTTFQQFFLILNNISSFLKAHSYIYTDSSFYFHLSLLLPKTAYLTDAIIIQSKGT